MSGRKGSLLGRAGGPVVSVLFHVALVVVLLKVLVFKAPEEEAVVAVTVVAPPVAKEVNEPEPETPELKQRGEQAIDAPENSLDELPPDILQDQTATSELDFSGLDAVADVSSPLLLKGVMVGRSASGRKKMLREFGGRYGSKAEKAVLKGLDWLVSTQNESGYWGVSVSKSMTAQQERARLTGLALLCFLAHGETARSEHYGEAVEGAIRFLLSQRDEKTGRFCPFSKTIGSHDDIGVYGHAIATYALTEAFALSRMPMLKEPVESGLKVIIAGQQKGGGWDHRYQHEKWSDLSVGGWQIQALFAAKAAQIHVAGLEAALERSVGFVQGMHAGEGKFYYRTGNKTPNGDLDYMSGVAVLCMQLAGSNRVSEVKMGLHYLKDVECSNWERGWEKTEKNKSFNIAYEWYYSTQAIFQKGGSKWSSWNNKFAPMLIEAQAEDGAWRPPGGAELEVSKDIIYTTTFCTLSLQVYYRILPSFKRSQAPAQMFRFANDVPIKILD